ncbi:hypothetical protein [Streptomyces atriruber]|uniref:hypothetical protein n=1 Tax=Streptomyces atriruber TaxID=545121 RepID=UPI0006E44E72|nr:hypothetical protein [Streptomyces atriruber]
MANAHHDDCNDDPDDVVYVPGMDYLSGWREADAVACEINTAAEALGVGEVVRAVPHSGPKGEPVVWLWPGGARVIARLLSVLASESRTS